MDLTVLLTTDTELKGLMLQLDKLADKYGYGQFFVHDAKHHGTGFSCLTITACPNKNPVSEFLRRDALKLVGVLEECPECAKRKKWESAWKQLLEGEVIDRGLPSATIIRGKL